MNRIKTIAQKKKLKQENVGWFEMYLTKKDMQSVNLSFRDIPFLRFFWFNKMERQTVYVKNETEVFDYEGTTNPTQSFFPFVLSGHADGVAACAAYGSG